MAREVIFANTTLPPFTEYSMFNAYGTAVEVELSMSVGETYDVEWDEQTHECVVQDASALMDGVFVLGNAEGYGLDGNEEPFVIAVWPHGVVDFLSLTDTQEGGVHTVSIYKGEAGGIVLKDRTGADVIHAVETVRFLMRDGTKQLFVNAGDVPVPVPTDIVPDFTDGKAMVVTPNAGNVFSEVTVQVPTGLSPENIVEGANVGGIDGTHKCESSGGGGMTFPTDPAWLDDICFWDYDGTLIMQLAVSDAKRLTELPTPPEHEGLVFQGWNYTLEEIQAAKYPYDIGAVYTTSDGKTHYTLKVLYSSSRAVPFDFSQDMANGVTFDWGDGTTSQSGTTVGAVSLTHTYPAVGTYEIVITVADGCTMTLGVSNMKPFVGGTNSTYKEYPIAMHIGNNVHLGPYAFATQKNLAKLTIPNSTQSEVPSTCFSSCYVLPAVIIPRNFTSVAQDGLRGCSGYYEGVRTEGKISIPATVTTLATGALQYNYCAQRIVVPPKVTEIPQNCFTYNYNLKRIFFDYESVTIYGSGAFNSLYFLKGLRIPEQIESLGNNFCYYNSCIEEMILPASLKTIGSQFFGSSAVKRLIVKGTITSVGNYAFSSCYSLREMIFLSDPGKGSAFAVSTTKLCKYFVPDEYVSSFKSAVGSYHKDAVYPLSEYPGELPGL